MTNESTSGDGNPSNENIFTHTTLPPEGYIQFTDFEDTPNLRNIHRHEYKSTHSKFTTRKPDEIYMERLEEIADRCNTNTTREGFEITDTIWHGDAPHPRGGNPVFRQYSETLCAIYIIPRLTVV